MLWRVRCKVQRAMAGRNAAIADDKRIVFRIGINVGDIIIDGDDIFGDGVNIAARLEALCEPGGVCISRAANEQIRDKLSLSFADLGEQAMKNISRAVGVYGLGGKRHHGAAGQRARWARRSRRGRLPPTSRRSTSARPATACSSPMPKPAGVRRSSRPATG